MPAEKALCLTIISGKPDDVSSEDWEKHIDEDVLWHPNILVCLIADDERSMSKHLSR